MTDMMFASGSDLLIDTTVALEIELLNVLINPNKATYREKRSKAIQTASLRMTLTCMRKFHSDLQSRGHAK